MSTKSNTAGSTSQPRAAKSQLRGVTKPVLPMKTEDGLDKDGIPFALKCPIIAAAADAPIEEFVPLIKAFVTQPNLPAWKGMGLIPNPGKLKIPKLFLLADVASQSTILHYASVNSAKHVDFLLRVGMKPLVNSRNKQGNTPLHIAFQHGDIEIVKTLLQYGANINMTNTMNATCLHFALLSDNPQVIDLCCKKMKKELVYQRDSDGISPHELSILRVHEYEHTVLEKQAKLYSIKQQVQELAEQEVPIAGDNTNTSEEEGASVQQNPLHEKLTQVMEYVKELEQEVEAYQLMLKQSKSNRVLVLSHTPYQTNLDVCHMVYIDCAKHGDVETISRLFTHNSKLQVDYIEPKSKYTALLYACMHGHIHVVKYLLGKQANRLYQANQSNIVLPKFIQEMIPSVLVPKYVATDALYLAIRGGHERIVRVLLDIPETDVDANTDKTTIAATATAAAAKSKTNKKNEVSSQEQNEEEKKSAEYPIEVVNTQVLLQCIFGETLPINTLVGKTKSGDSTTTSAASVVSVFEQYKQLYAQKQKQQQQINSKPITKISTMEDLLVTFLPYLCDKSFTCKTNVLTLACAHNMQGICQFLLQNQLIDVNERNCVIEVQIKDMYNTHTKNTSLGLEFVITAEDFTSLHCAIKNRNSALVIDLLKAKADPNLTCIDWLQSLGIDIIANTEYCFPINTSKFKDTYIPVRFTLTSSCSPPVVHAVEQQLANVVHALYSNGADLNKKNLKYCTVAHVAGLHNHRQVLAYIIANTKLANIDVCDENWLTPLAYACKNDQLDTVTFILSQLSAQDYIYDVAGANMISFLSKLQLTPGIHPDVLMNCMKLSLHVKTKDVGVYHGSAVRALRTAVACGSILSIKVLLACMKDKYVVIRVAAQDTKQEDKQFHNYEFEGKQIYTSIDGHGLIVNNCSVEYAKAHVHDQDKVILPLSAYLATEQLTTVCQKGYVSILLELLDYDALPIISGLYGATFIEMYHKLYTCDIASNRIRCKPCKYVHISKNPFSPLSIAIANGNQDIVQVLLGCTPAAHKLIKQDKYDQNKDEYLTPLVGVIPVEQLKTIPPYLHPVGIFMLAKRQGSKGFTPLHLCASEEQPLLTSLLLKAKADINAQDDDGNTPLHTAIRHSNRLTLEILMAASADATIKNKNGYSAVHVAAVLGRPALVKGLVTYCKGTLDEPTPTGESVVALMNQALAKLEIEELEKQNSKK